MDFSSTLMILHNPPPCAGLATVRCEHPQKLTRGDSLTVRPGERPRVECAPGARFVYFRQGKAEDHEFAGRLWVTPAPVSASNYRSRDRAKGRPQGSRTPGSC